MSADLALIHLQWIIRSVLHSPFTKNVRGSVRRIAVDLFGDTRTKDHRQRLEKLTGKSNVNSKTIPV